MRKIICVTIMLTLIFSQSSAFAEAFISPDGKRMIAATSTSREAPAKLGEIVYMQDIQGNMGSITEMELVELFVGDEAEKIALVENDLNNEAAIDMQYVLARFKISFQAMEQSKNLMLFSDNFSVVTKQGNVVKSSIVRDKSKAVYGFNTQDQIYSGASTVIDVPLLIKKVDDVLLINYYNAWFQISELPPFSDPNGVQFGWNALAVIAQLRSSFEIIDHKIVDFVGGGERVIVYGTSLYGKDCYAYYDIKDISLGVDTMWYSFPLPMQGEGATDIISYLLEFITTSYGRCTYIGHEWINESAEEEYATDLDKAIYLGFYQEPMMWMLKDNVSIYIDEGPYAEGWKSYFSSESGMAITVMITQSKK